MESTTFFKSKSGKQYLYDNNNSMFLLVHPVIKYFYQLEKKGMNIEDIIDNLKEENNIKDIGIYSRSEIEYYFFKYKFLKENNFFTLVKKHQRVLPNITPDSIRYYTANIKQILFEVTESCNLNCAYCTYNELFYESYNRKNTNLSIESAKSIIDYFEKIWNSKLNMNEEQNVIISFYGGEPLLNIKFINELIDYISAKKSLKKNVSYSITTNGILLKKYIDLLVINDFMVTVSLDGNYKNNQYRVDHNNKNPHKQIVNDLKEIMKKYPEFYENNISFNTVLHDKNSVESVLNFFGNELNKTTKIMEINTDGVKSERKEDLMKMLNNISLSYSDAASKGLNVDTDDWDLAPNNQMLTLLRGLWSNYLRTYGDLFHSKVEQERPITGTCSPFWKRMFITSKGFILPCERIDYKYYLGKVEENAVLLDFDEIAKKYNNYYRNIYGQCNRCYMSRSCLQCMFYVDNIETKPVCNEFLDKKGFSQYLSNIYSLMETEPAKIFSLLEKTIYE